MTPEAEEYLAEELAFDCGPEEGIDYLLGEDEDGGSLVMVDDLTPGVDYVWTVDGHGLMTARWADEVRLAGYALRSPRPRQPRRIRTSGRRRTTRRARSPGRRAEPDEPEPPGDLTPIAGSVAAFLADLCGPQWAAQALLSATEPLPLAEAAERLLSAPASVRDAIWEPRE